MRIKASAPKRVAGVDRPDLRDHCGKLNMDADCTEDAVWLSAIYRHLTFGEPMPGPCPTAPIKRNH